MPNPLLDGLEQKATLAVVNGRLSWPASWTGELELAGLPSWLLPQVGLELTASSIVRVSDGELKIAGRYGHPAFGEVELRFDIVVTNGRLFATVSVAPSSPLDVSRFLQSAGVGGAFAFGRFLSGLNVTGFSSAQTRDGMLAVIDISGGHTIELAGLKARAVIDRAKFALASPQSALLEGHVKVGSLALNMWIKPGSEPKIELEADALSLADLMSALNIPLPALPPLPLLSQQFAALAIETREGEYSLGGILPWAGVGTIVVSVCRTAGVTGVVASVVIGANRKFSDMSPALAPLDIILPVIEFGVPALTLSSITATAFPVMDVSHAWHRVPIQQGVTLQGQLKLQGFGLDLIKAVVGEQSLPFAIPVDPTFSNLQIQANLSRSVDVLPGVLSVDRFVMALVPHPLSASVQGDAHLTLFGTRLPEMILGANVTPTTQNLSVRAAEPWKNPLGLPITIEQFGVQISGPIPAYGFFGTIKLTDRILDVAAQFSGGTITFLVAALQGEISLLLLLRDLTQLNLPTGFEPVLKDASIYLVLDPAGATVVDRRYEQGIAIGGTLRFVGLEARSSLSIKSGRLMAEGALGGPIDLGPLLRVTGAGASPAPSISIDSGRSPMATLSGRVEVLGMSQEVQGAVSTNSITLALHDRVGPVEVSGTATVLSGAFKLDAAAAFRLNASIGPLNLLNGGPDLGTLHIDVNFTANVRASGPVPPQVFVSGVLVVAGIQVSIPETAVSINSFAQIPEAVVAYIRNNASTLLRELLTNAEAWLHALADKLITGVDNVARALIAGFNKDAQYAARVLSHTLRAGVDEIARQLQGAGQAAAAIASSLADLNRAPNEIRTALERLKFPEADIGKAMRAAFPGVPHVDTYTVPHGDVAAAPHHDVGAVHTDIAPVHTDIKTPHTDVKTGHNDYSTGHIDSGFPIHTDIGGSHTDVGGIHTDVGGIHTDTLIAPHQDISTPHQDIGAKAHIDTPASGHIDTP